MRTFDSLTEREILALVISTEEEDARIYDDFADGLKENYPEQAEKFKRLRQEEDGHRRRDRAARTGSDRLGPAQIHGHTLVVRRGPGGARRSAGVRRGDPDRQLLRVDQGAKVDAPWPEGISRNGQEAQAPRERVDSRNRETEARTTLSTSRGVNAKHTRTKLFALRS
jgi:hypothetical protein